MKKINSVILCCLIFLAMMQVYAVEENKLRYEIIFDSCEEHENEVIQKVIMTYHELTKYVTHSDRSVILRQSLHEFKFDEKTSVTFEIGVLKIVMGDGKGSIIQGSFQPVECGVEVETSSWILEVLGF